MNEHETERRLQQWLDNQRRVAAPLELHARVAAIPTVVDVPWRERLNLALGILPGPDARLRRVLVVVVLAALIGSVLATAALVGNQPRLAVVVPPSSASPTAGPAASATASPATSTNPELVITGPNLAETNPIPSGDTACIADLLNGSAGGSPLPRDSTPALEPGEAVAGSVLGQPDKQKLFHAVGVRVTTASSVTTVATFTSAAPFGPLTNATIVGWSRDGTTLLLSVGRWSPSFWNHECLDLYVARTDGSSLVRLTENRGPGQTVWVEALAPGGGSVAYVEEDESVGAWSLRLWDDSGATTALDASPCKSSPTALAWSPDGRSLAVSCEDSVILLYRVPGGEKTELVGAPHTVVKSIGWTSDSARVVAAVLDQNIYVDEFDLSGGHTVHRDLDARPDLGPVGGFSPDGSKLLLGGCPKTPTDPTCLATELDVLDVATGRLSTIFSGPGTMDTNDAVQSGRWLPDGRVVMRDPKTSGTLVIDPMTGKSTPSDWPPEAVRWRPSN